ncbi:MAG: hypothetical protein IJP68_04505 [Selenomonadaceae bacterium]|nr:hypothetical protein [Selenomonadaceae bacterium]
MAEEKYAGEIMSDEDLDNVAGGTCYEMADDSRFLNCLNGSIDRYGATKIWFGDYSYEIQSAWEKIGVNAIVSGNTSRHNKYRIGNRILSQEEARQHAMKVTGHYMKESDWKW